VYRDLFTCIKDLEKVGMLKRIVRPVDPYLEMADIHRETFAKKGPALFFEKVKGSEFPAVSNLFGTRERLNYIFRKTLPVLKKLISLYANPWSLARKPSDSLYALTKVRHAVPLPVWKAAVQYRETSIEKLPQIYSYPNDGGPFITLPQVYSEDPEKRGWRKSNLGMYRVQLQGNHYQLNKEVGLHYQIHRGIAIHHSAALKKDSSLPVSIFVGGPPAHAIAAMMPLPEGMSELMFAGVLSGHSFRYKRYQEHLLSAYADFCLVGYIHPGNIKPEGPFGDHLGYYSLKHDFPVLTVKKIFHKNKAIWPFTVVGRPPQEDSLFSQLVHELTAEMVPIKLPGVHKIYAVDAAGVHPLLFALGSERYLPYEKRCPKELLTQANSILGFGQCSLAKYLFILAYEDNPYIDLSDEKAVFSHMCERIDWQKDLHFHTRMSMDTLDYSGEGLHQGSKVVFAAAGAKKRTLCKSLVELTLPNTELFVFIAAGIIACKKSPFNNYLDATREMLNFGKSLEEYPLPTVALIIVCDQPRFLAKSFSNFLWVTFTRSNPSHDIYGVKFSLSFKHWGCKGPLIIDARKKSHHAPILPSRSQFK